MSDQQNNIQPKELGTKIVELQTTKVNPLLSKIKTKKEKLLEFKRRFYAQKDEIIQKENKIREEIENWANQQMSDPTPSAEIEEEAVTVEQEVTPVEETPVVIETKEDEIIDTTPIEETKEEPAVPPVQKSEFDDLKTGTTYIPVYRDTNRGYKTHRPEGSSGGNYRPAGTSTGYSTPAPTAPVPVDSGKGGFGKKKGVKPDKKNSKGGFDDKAPLGKKAKIQKGYTSTVSDADFDELNGDVMKIRTRKATSSDKDKRKIEQPQAVVITNAIVTAENFTIKYLSERIGKTGVEIIRKLFELSIIKTINDVIDFDTAELVASEFGITLEKQIEKTSEEKLFAVADDDSEDNDENLEARPPIVTIMGHVDHGKTSILDYIRKANVVAGEAGGITQHIGAYTAVCNNQKITFIDTPGHAAFTEMRARGANVTDIVIIVVAADDGIMPQTVEAISHAKAAKVDVIIALNKMDKPHINPDNVLNQLADAGLVPEEWGGDVPVVRVSAVTGQGINELLETLLFRAEFLELKANPARTAKGTIIEARLDKGKGPVATILVQNGTLKIGDFIVAGTAIGRIRAMFDDKGRQVSKALPSSPVSILGLQDVPNAGDQIVVVKDEKLSKQVVEDRKNREKIEKLKTRRISLDDVFKNLSEGKKDLNIILKADVQGSAEALTKSLLELSNDEVRVNVIHSAVGAINESDIMLANTSSAVIIGFNIRPDANVKNLAEKNGVEIRVFKIIYEAIQSIENAIKGLEAPKYHEEYLGRAVVKTVFKLSSAGVIAGCVVEHGKIQSKAKVRLIRNNSEIYSSEIASLKHYKEDVKEIGAGRECGISILNYNDIKVDDVIEAFLLSEDE